MSDLADRLRSAMQVAEDPRLRNPYGLAERLQEMEAAGEVPSGTAGIKRSSLNSYLSGQQVPRPDALHAICAALNISPEWLVAGEPPMRAVRSLQPHAVWGGSVNEQLGVWGGSVNEQLLQALGGSHDVACWEPVEVQAAFSAALSAWRSACPSTEHEAPHLRGQLATMLEDLLEILTGQWNLTGRSARDVSAAKVLLLTAVQVLTPPPGQGVPAPDEGVAPDFHLPPHLRRSRSDG